MSEGYDAIFDSENWREVQSINLDGVFWMMKYGAPECAKGGNGVLSLIHI